MRESFNLRVQSFVDNHSSKWPAWLRIPLILAMLWLAFSVYWLLSVTPPKRVGLAALPPLLIFLVAPIVWRIGDRLFGSVNKEQETSSSDTFEKIKRKEEKIKALKRIILNVFLFFVTPFIWMVLAMAVVGVAKLLL